jgi:tRNA nucleotidyltransferase (CCA-adding enzyme)
MIMDARSLLTSDLLDLRKLFQVRGFDIRLVGGCVRDLIAGIEPKDVDLCTDADPDEQVSIYQAAGIRYVETGIEHGTITVVLDGAPYEITSLRLDVETDGRRATVAYTKDWLKDLERRDFTINAMSLTLDGELVDPFNGLKALSEGLVEFVGNAETRIREDYLRILRWFRFRGRFGMSMSYSANRAILALASGLKEISRERVWSEVSRIISGNDGPYIMLEMHQMSVAQWIDLPDEVDWINVAQEVAEISRNPVTLMVALYGQEAEGILRRWKASGAEIRLAEKLRWSISGHTAINPFYAMAVLGWSRKDARELAAISRLDAFNRAVLEEWPVPAFPVNGNDLIAAGLVPSPEFSRRIGIMKNRWADTGYTASKQELMALFD